MSEAGLNTKLNTLYELYIYIYIYIKININMSYSIFTSKDFTSTLLKF